MWIKQQHEYFVQAEKFRENAEKRGITPQEAKRQYNVLTGGRHLRKTADKPK